MIDIGSPVQAARRPRSASAARPPARRESATAVAVRRKVGRPPVGSLSPPAQTSPQFAGFDAAGHDTAWFFFPGGEPAGHLDPVPVSDVLVRDRREQGRLLHDTLLNTLTAISWGGRTEERPVPARDSGSVRRRCRRDVEVVERFFRGHEHWEAETDLRAMLRRVVDGARAVGLDATFSCDSRIADVEVPARVAAGLADATGEALANVRRHSGVVDVEVVVSVDDHTISVTVVDHGVGFDASSTETGSGSSRLGIRRSILGRMADLGGYAWIVSAPGRGTSVRLDWSVPAEPRPSGSRPPSNAAFCPTPNRKGHGRGASGDGGPVHPEVVEDRRRHLSALQTGALLLVRAIAGGDLDPDDNGVRERCAVEARALRHALARERDDDDFFLELHELDHDAAARGVHLDVQAEGDARRLSAATRNDIVAAARALVRGVRSGRALLTVMSSDAGCRMFLRGPVAFDPARSPSAAETLRTAASSFSETDDDHFYMEIQWLSKSVRR
jgi:hypothetical protein